MGGWDALAAATEGIDGCPRLPYDLVRVDGEVEGEGMHVLASKGGLGGGEGEGGLHHGVKWSYPLWCNAGSALFENLPS